MKYQKKSIKLVGYAKNVRIKLLDKKGFILND